MYNPRRIFERPLPALPEIGQNHGEVNEAPVLNDVAGDEVDASDGVLLLNEPEPIAPLHDENGIDDDVVPIIENIEVIIIESDDEDVEPSESKQDILPRVKVENLDLSAIQIILNGEANGIIVEPPRAVAAEPVHRTDAALPVDLSMRSRSNEVAAAALQNQAAETPPVQADPSDANEIVFLSPSKPRRAKLESDDLSALIPYTKNGRTYIAQVVSFLYLMQ